MKNIIKYSGYNYSLISSYFNSLPISRHQEFYYLQEHHTKGFFINLKKNELNYLLSSDVSIEKKAFAIYSLQAYKFNKEGKSEAIHSKYDFFHDKEIYKNYLYKYIYPEYSENNIRVKISNDLICEFLLKFQYEYYLKQIKIKNIELGFYADFYYRTNDHFLKGILIEELAFLFFKNSKFNLNQEIRTFFHTIVFSYYSKGTIIKEDETSDYPFYEKINNCSLRSLNIQQEKLVIKLEKIKKFYLQDDQFFGGDKLLKLANGIYFLNHTFPIIDAIMVNQERKNLILIQIKKTMEQKLIDSYLDDFHILYFLMENSVFYEKISEFLISKYNTEIPHQISKLQLFMRLANFIKSDWSINFMFVYRFMDNSFNVISDNQILENHYLMKGPKIATSFALPDDNLQRTESIGIFKFENKTVTLYRRRILHNILLVDLNSFTNGLIDDKKFSSYIKNY